MLDGLQQQIGNIKDELGKLQAQASVTSAGSTAPKVIPPTSNEEIVGGEETEQFPDCCAVGDDRGYYCSGTLIAPNVVVTADHCENVTRVFLKGNDVSRPGEGEVLRVVRELSHPEVDLKVLVLERDSEMPPRHVAQGDEVANAKTATLAGFGTIDLHGSLG
jgi:hypothetical protein